ncbi:MAG TPA: Rrf2 family transcriptional regulator [Clostridiaceae bacterium]
MKISTKGTYGLKAMVDLALNSNNDYITLKSISERQDISERYLEQIFSMLRKAELVKSIKGAQGGYTLGAKGLDTTVGEILRTLEGALLVSEESVDHNKVSKIDYCVSENIWKKLNHGINEMVDSINLEKLVFEYKKLNDNIKDMYYI